MLETVKIILLNISNLCVCVCVCVERDLTSLFPVYLPEYTTNGTVY